MKTAEQILKDNKSRMANVITLGGAHARLAGLFFHLAVYDLQVDMDNIGYNKLSLDVYYDTDEEKELIKAILDNYNMQFMEVEEGYLSKTKSNFVKITCRY